MTYPHSEKRKFRFCVRPLPHGSAGPPILAAIEGRQLVNTLCVVIRYFGGTKLGIGGLIRAYGGTAAEVL
ncbi:YigZ family protein, partial [bacterium]|nr:YigZ family protein [bacterium]